MSEQAMDVRSLASLVRRNLRLVVAAVVLGAVAGALVVLLGHSPAYHSTSQVLLPPVPADQVQQGGRDSATQVRIAQSQVVLEPAGRSMHAGPHSRPGTEAGVGIGGDAGRHQDRRRGADRSARRGIGSCGCRAGGRLPGRCSQLAVASRAGRDRGARPGMEQSLASVNDEIKQTNGRLDAERPDSRQHHADETALGQLTAQQAELVLQVDALKERSQASQVGGQASVIEAASPAERTEPVLLYLVAALAGALTGLALTLMVLVGAARRDRRLRTRDEIADSLGSAVVGTVHAHPQRSVAGWTALLETYDPTVTDRWSLRQVLHHVGLGELTVHTGQGRPTSGRRRSLTVVTLSDDYRALAVGPQLASHAASLGIRTKLSTGQGHDAAASLWSAAASLRRDSEIRPDLSLDNRRQKRGTEVDLSVRLVVVDQRRPQFAERPSGGVTLLAISSGAATPDDLARTAVAAYENGSPISGVIVVDPDPLDRTTGRLLLQQRTEQRPLPMHITGVVNPESTPKRAWERGGSQ